MKRYALEKMERVPRAFLYMNCALKLWSLVHVPILDFSISNTGWTNKQPFCIPNGLQNLLSPKHFRQYPSSLPTHCHLNIEVEVATFTQQITTGNMSHHIPLATIYSTILSRRCLPSLKFLIISKFNIFFCQESTTNRFATKHQITTFEVKGGIHGGSVEA